MPVIIHSLTELNQVPDPGGALGNALKSGVGPSTGGYYSGLLRVQLNTSSQLGARGQGDQDKSPLKINIYGCRWKRGVIP